MDSKLLRQERVVAAAGAVLLAASYPLDVLLFPESPSATPVTVAAAVLAALAHATWISMDRTRRGREVGAWRFLAIFIGPLAVLLYLLLEYRLRGLLYAVYYVALFAGATLLGIAGAYAVLRLQGVA